MVCAPDSDHEGRDETKGVFLGLGGPTPGAAVVCPWTGTSHGVLALPPGESVYALAATPARDAVFAGTRTGGVYRLTLGPVSAATGHREWLVDVVTRAPHPILSLAAIDRTRVAASDGGGRC